MTNEQNTVLITGCFDILHVGHIELLKFARKEFTQHIYDRKIKPFVVVGIDSDEKVKKDKGNDRPYNNQEDRRYMLESLKYVDDVFVFFDDEHLKDYLKMYKPDVRICGSDWKGKKIVGAEFCKSIVFFDRIPGHSTTNILQGIKKK